ncbi:MAG TPA: hypothetical protein VJC39_05315 [Candidatus Nanoarchaeia archaeon]|nr:hypothetical protein [Candidatus Nanoarchaeia archaeon]
MLSLGACLVDDTDIQFYREIKPVSCYFIEDAMRVGSLGLNCLNGVTGEEYDPRGPYFNPGKVLILLGDKGDTPSNVMSDFASWIRVNTRGCIPVEAAFPIKFDGMYTAWYFDNFYQEKNPLGFGGEDIGSFYRGLSSNPQASLGKLGVEDKRNPPHNALQDAIYQAEQFAEILKLIPKK